MKLSIITVNLNNGSGLEQTIQSVVSQTNRDFEYIVIDGGSKDNSMEVIHQYAKRINFWVSEPDKGIYNAMNKGIEKAKGDYCLFLNSADTLVDEHVLQDIEAYFGKADILYGDMIGTSPTRETVMTFPNSPNFNYMLRNTLPHQSSFIRRSALYKGGLYDESLYISSDWKFFLNAICKYNFSTMHMDRVISKCDYRGISSEEKNKKIIYDELKKILKEEYNFDYDEFQELKRIYTLYQKFYSSKGWRFYRKVKSILKMKHS